MIIATRTLVLHTIGPDIEIAIQLRAPEETNGGWVCRFDIGWPEGSVERWGTGSDAVQALLIAMQMIGAEIHASPHHEAGKLEWLAQGHGYGFPVPGHIRDLLIRDDRRYL